jgi:hypothetical protein
MFSRLVAFAASLAIVGAASLAFSASAQPAAAHAELKPVRIVQLERVVVTAKRLHSDAR